MKLAFKYQDSWEDERRILLSTCVCDLRLRFADTVLSDCIEKLYKELSKKKIQFHPKYYFSCGSYEWGCPDRVPIIGIPFHLADNRLIRIHKEMGCSGYSRSDLIQLLRHEAGHVFNYAYQLYATPEWKAIFGDFKAPYPIDFKFRFNPYSRRFVRSQGVPKYYAQAHPDEDFAETFAVWLTPRSNWRVVYRAWPARRKLEYVDRVMRSLIGKKPKILAGPLDSPYHAKSYTLSEYYSRKRKS